MAQFDPVYYYDLRNIAFSQTDEEHLNSIPIPIRNVDSYFSIYRTHELPVLVNHTSDEASANATLITDLPNFIGVSQNSVFLSHADIATCKGDIVLSCPLFLLQVTEKYRVVR